MGLSRDTRRMQEADRGAHGAVPYYVASVRVIALVLLLLLGGAGVFGGVSFLTHPDGSALGLSLELLPEWYAASYWWPGLVLLVAFGAGPVMAGGLLLLRAWWGWVMVAGLGATLLVWMLAQVVMIGLILPPMQLGFLALGVTLIALGSWALRGGRADRRGQVAER